VGTKCHYCGKGGHWRKDCYKHKSHEVGGEGAGRGRAREFTFLGESLPVLVGTGWIIDSGACQHLSIEGTQFITYRKVSGEQAITIADGTKINAQGIGDIEIATIAGVIRLTEVCHVPTIEASLILVARMVDTGYAVGFEASRCNITKAGRKIEIGFISKKRVCSGQIGIACRCRISAWSILSAQRTLRGPQQNGCILVRWMQDNPHIMSAQCTWMGHFTR